jgi:hypothetical protein
MKKLIVIARNEITLRYADPVILLMTIAMPLMIAALINLAFGNVVLGRSIPEAQVPVGIVNQDRGSEWGNFGQLLVRAMTPDPTRPALPADLHLAPFVVREVADEMRARRLVESEELVAALLIPPPISLKHWQWNMLRSKYISTVERIYWEWRSRVSSKPWQT